MYPDRKTAHEALAAEGRRNPGPWTAHSLSVARAAEAIAARCEGMDAEKAYVCGLLHDIGRGEGVYGARHIVDGYAYAMERGWDEIARICLTHSFPVKDEEKNIARRDYTPAQQQLVRDFLASIQYDDYDRLIILCDALGEAEGCCILEKRLVDVARRYGLHSFTLELWERIFEYKEYFEQRIGQSVYNILPKKSNQPAQWADDSRKKALVINCSPVKNRATAAIASIAAERLGEKADTLCVCIDDYEIALCRGCRSCEVTARCPLHGQDDHGRLVSLMEQADFILSVVPSYWADVPAQFKAFIDRCTPWCDSHDPHASLPAGKSGAAIALRAGPGEAECRRIITTVTHFYGHMKIEHKGDLALCGINSKEDALRREEEISLFVDSVSAMQ